MKNKIKYFTLLLAAGGTFFLSACAIFDSDKSLLAPQRWGLIDKNRANLKKLRIGMTKDEVRNIMGEPLVKEVYETSDHWFYYTRTRWADGMNTRDECTPLVFSQNGLLEGWGMEFYRTHYNYIGWTDKAIRQVLE